MSQLEKQKEIPINRHVSHSLMIKESTVLNPYIHSLSLSFYTIIESNISSLIDVLFSLDQLRLHSVAQLFEKGQSTYLKEIRLYKVKKYPRELNIR